LAPYHPGDEVFPWGISLLFIGNNAENYKAYGLAPSDPSLLSPIAAFSQGQCLSKPLNLEIVSGNAAAPNKFGKGSMEMAWHPDAFGPPFTCLFTFNPVIPTLVKQPLFY
jgi:hypothetical protein